MFGALALGLTLGALGLRGTGVMKGSMVIGAALGVWFAVTVIQGWSDEPSSRSGSSYEQPDEDRWLRP